MLAVDSTSRLEQETNTLQTKSGQKLDINEESARSCINNCLDENELGEFKDTLGKDPFSRQ